MVYEVEGVEVTATRTWWILIVLVILLIYFAKKRPGAIDLLGFTL